MREQIYVYLFSNGRSTSYMAGCHLVAQVIADSGVIVKTGSTGEGRSAGGD